ncbi:MAG: S-layer homology domain-containing protein, partial [Clostridiales bacterium]|nr:S-layer homology domain-containing protein [Clostridiales bacterium]
GFADADEISDYAKDAVGLLASNGLIKGSAGRINPLGKATRAEIAVIVLRFMDKLSA